MLSPISLLYFANEFQFCDLLKHILELLFLEGINDLVDFECEDLKGVEKEFHEAVDDYLEFCKEVGKEPDKEYKGTFNVRISPELHKRLVTKSFIPSILPLSTKSSESNSTFV